MDSTMTASDVSSVVFAEVDDGGAGREREGRPSEEKMDSPPASSAVCSWSLDAMV